MGKTAIVTGASRGIGFAIAKQLRLDGYCIAILDLNAKSDYQHNLDQLGDDAYLYIQGDVRNAKDRILLVEETVDRFGGIHVLVNNAGIAPKVRCDLLDMSEDSFDDVIGTNTKGPMFLTQMVAKQMINQSICGNKRGTIVNVSSLSTEVSSISRGEYCVSKAGISMLTKLYADRLAGEGILVHEVRPGVIESDMTRPVKAKYDALFQAGVFPITRWGKPEDVANVVSALVSDKFLYTTGGYVNVDGGFHIKRL